MANSFVRYTGDGSTTQYAVSFSYRDQADVTVTINGVVTNTYSWNAAGTQITFTSPPASSSAIEIRRRTSQTSRLVDYAAGSVLTENDLDTDSNQAFFMGQEAIDDAGDVIKLDAANFQWDVQNKRLTNVADPVNDTDAVNKQFISTNIPNINTVAGISADVTSVANIASNVTSVANNEADIDLVALNMPSVTTVANNISDVVTVANDLNEAISEIETAANDLNEATSEIDTVSNNIVNVNIVGTNIGDVSTVATANTDIQTLADLEDGTVTTNGLSTLAGLNTEIQGVYNIRTNVTNVDTNSANVNLVAGQISPTNNVSAVGAVATEIGTLGALGTEITNLNNIRTDISGVNTISAEVTAVNNNSTNINTVAGLNTEITALGASGTVASINTVATNINSVNSFANTYLGASATAPTQDPDGSALDLGDLYFDTSTDTMRVYGSGGWQAAGSSVNGTAARYKFTATASQTTFTTDDTSAALAYDPTFLDVYLNGIKLVNGSDFTATTGNSIVLSSGANASDILEVIAYGTFSLANFSITDANDVPTLGSAGQALVVNSGGTALEFANASSAEVYGFHKDSNGDLIVTTTNQGVDNISQSEYANFDDVLFSASGFTFSLSNGELIATI